MTYEIGAVIKAVRKEQALSIEDVSGKSNIPVQTLYTIERGESNPKFDTILSISEAMDYPVVLLMMKSLKGDRATEKYTEIVEALNKNEVLIS
ncbi:TPA: XRE family transcriptional regulator [Candidatus Peregrinibacteria bacterium]|nr:XRE family transcriptional regulator [Candidatus Peregrinibacteria bacterium]